MANDGLTIHYIVNELKNEIINARVDKIAQPSNDTLIFTLRGKSNTFKLLLSCNAALARIHLSQKKYENPEQAPMFCMLLRKQLLGARLINIEQLGNDRCVNLYFEAMDEMKYLSIKKLVIEIMAKHSNIIFVDGNGLIIDSIFRVGEDMSRVRQILPGLEYTVPPKQDKLNPFITTSSELKEYLIKNIGKSLESFFYNCISGISSQMAKELAIRTSNINPFIINQENIDFLSKNIIELFKTLDGLYHPQLLEDNNKLPLDFLPFKFLSIDANFQIDEKTISESMEKLYLKRDIKDKIKQKSGAISKVVNNHISRIKNRLNQIEILLSQEEEANEYKRFGELITASLYCLNQDDYKGKDMVCLLDYYSENCPKIFIKINKELSLKDNAKMYFKKYKKIKKAISLADEQKEKALLELRFLEAIALDIDMCESLVELEEIKMALIDQGYIKKDRKAKLKKPQESAIKSVVSEDGIQIVYGKNSVQNDRITKQAQSLEIWLHVQGAPGSHVVIKQDKNVSENTIEYAAKIAAYNSSLRNSTIIPVDYTLKKYVKKPPASAAGFVIYTNYKTIFINLSDSERAKLSKL